MAITVKQCNRTILLLLNTHIPTNVLCLILISIFHDLASQSSSGRLFLNTIHKPINARVEINRDRRGYSSKKKRLLFFSKFIESPLHARFNSGYPSSQSDRQSVCQLVNQTDSLLDNQAVIKTLFPLL